MDDKVVLGDLELTKAHDAATLSGVSEKNIYNSENETPYFVKKQKSRKVAEIFKGDPTFLRLIKEREEICAELGVTFDPYTEKPMIAVENELKKRLTEELWIDYQALQAQIDKYAQHVRDVMISNTTLEILAPKIAKAIVDDLIVPENIFFMDKKGTPCTASKSVGELDEFLTHHELVKNKKTPQDWEGNPIPTMKGLLLSPEESENEATKKAELLGEAFAVALLMGHLDLVNNINLSNFGSINDAQTHEKKLCIVDWGNSLGAGFGGLTADESTFSNPTFNQNPNTATQNPITGFKHVLPFDTIVVPSVPRQVIADLFDITNTDNPNLRHAELEGFEKACEKMYAKVNQIEMLVTHAIEETIESVPAVVVTDDGCENNENREIFVHALPHNAKPGLQAEVGSLTDILKGRIQSSNQICTELKAGQSLSHIADNRLKKMKQSQNITYFRVFKDPNTEQSKLDHDEDATRSLRQ